ncbi:hypothetical protein EES41_30760 [Streptomyces sp. ADI95-16]|uniref:phosphoribosyltransferase-like protein n=1 Tax=Streptomyces sp. ADI95-16 TaxID=1522758 RepID=UPI000F3A808B|nr:hypothetical protein [Streptomyces sp. ADI95-16]AYV31117.1 hypothetical protein EES41_30760 [Streptomyces sp. ADI95-16]
MAMRMRGERVPTRPSETRQGIEWLTNFAPGDTAAAQLLLNSLHVVSETTFRQELSEQLRSTLTTDANVPAALYSVRSCRPTDTMFIGDVSPLVSSGDGGGSELIVQNILRPTERSLDTAVVARSATTIDVLRARRVRSLVFVSDYAGSGEECLAYARAWLRNATIRSWRSLKLVRLHLMLFASTTAGLRRIRSSGLYDQVSVIHHGMDFASMQWSRQEAERVSELCVEYARRPEEGLGWSRSGGLLVFEHTVPNNLPAILRQTKGRTRRPDGQWAPFFMNRVVPPGLMRELVGYRPEYDPLLGLRAVGQVRLARAGEHHTRARGGIRHLVEVLAHVAKGRRHPEQLASAVAVSVPAAREILAQARRWGLVDDQTRLTDAGRDELRAAKIRPRQVVSRLRGSQEPYYPVALRESQ